MFIQGQHFSHHVNANRNCHSFTFDVSRLDAGKCHVIFPLTPSKEHLIMAALEFLTFHPNTPINVQFQACVLHCNDITFLWYSFPKEFQKTCERAAKVYNMTMHVTSRRFGVNAGTKEQPEITIVDFPLHQNLLFFKEATALSMESLAQETDMIKNIGDTLENLGID